MAHLLNEDVLNAISKFLDIPDLKSCRLVCKLWTSGFKPTLPSRSMVRLYCEFSTDEAEEGIRELTELDTNTKFMEEMTHFQVSNLHLSFGEYGDPDCSKSGKQSLVDLNRKLFMQTIKPRQLTLSAKFLSEEWEIEFFLQVLKNYSNSLEALQFQSFGRDVLVGLQDGSLNLWNRVQFPKLNKLTMCQLYAKYHDTNYASCFQGFQEGFHQAFPNVKEFVVKSELLTILFAPKSQECRFLRDITGLSVYCFGEGPTKDELELLLEETTSLKKLEILDCNLDENVLLEELISKHKETLTELQISISPHETEVLKLPRFPILKKLSIKLDNGDNEFEFEQPPTTGNVRNRALTFGRIDYAYNFPKLQELFAKVAVWTGETDDFFNSWFPEDVTHIAQTVRIVEYFCPKGFNFRASNPRPKPKFFRLPKLFPNAQNEFIRKLAGLAGKRKL